jgi:TonB family protein
VHRWDFTNGQRDGIGVAVSVGAHAAVVILLVVLGWGERRSDDPPPAKDWVTFSVRDKPAAGLASEAPKKPDLNGQVVDIPKPDVERLPPPDARFLSRWNTAVDREVKARDRGRKRPAAAPAPEPAPEPAEAPKPAAPEKQVARKPAGDAKEGAGVRLPERGRAAGRPGEGGEPTLRGMGGMDRLLLPTVDGGGRAAARNMKGLAGGYVSDDAMLGVPDEGDTTLVNSRSFKYFDFFQRVKERVRDEWNPGDMYRARDPYGKVYGSRDRLTVLNVVLDADGRVSRLDVAKQSGLPFLDQEAMRAFREAGPFPNPPIGLADDSGRIAFHFGFLLEVS